MMKIIKVVPMVSKFCVCVTHLTREMYTKVWINTWLTENKSGWIWSESFDKFAHDHTSQNVRLVFLISKKYTIWSQQYASSELGLKNAPHA